MHIISEKIDDMHCAHTISDFKKYKHMQVSNTIFTIYAGNLTQLTNYYSFVYIVSPVFSC